jgi:GNAT superfamily N-acetyltransferase
MLVQVGQLNPIRLASVEALRSACKQHDGQGIPIYSHLLANPRPLDSTVLYYEKKRLIGFLSAYFFYEKTCEMAVMIHPEHRRKRIATVLLSEISPLLMVQNIERLIFTTPFTVDHGTCWLQKYGFEYINSEYDMERNDLTVPEVVPIPDFHIRTLTDTDHAFCSTMDQVCFGKGEVPDARFYEWLYDPSYTIFVAEYQGVTVGKAHIHWQLQRTHLTDIAILPEWRRKGFANALLAHCIQYILSTGKSAMVLQVETQNQKALQLYTQLGFVVTNSCDYWQVPLTDFQSAL